MSTRRAFLQRVLAAGALSVVPNAPMPLGAWERWRRQQIRAAWRSATALGRPLLAIVVPDTLALRADRESLWGAVLTHGTDETIARLSGAVLVTATPRELRDRLPGFALGEAPLFVVLSVGTLPVPWHAYSTPIYPTGSLSLFPDAEGLAAMDTAVMAQVASVEALIAVALPVWDGPPAPLRTEPVAGSRWGERGGCGDHFEQPDPVADAMGMLEIPDRCGMGHVNPRSARFLSFIVQ